MPLFAQHDPIERPAYGRTTLALIQSRLHGTPLQRSGCIKTLARFHCNDGFSLSVQASEIHASTPARRTGPYSHVECGCLSDAVPALMPYRVPEDGVRAQDLIYRYVPIEVLFSVLTRHGGLRV